MKKLILGTLLIGIVGGVWFLTKGKEAVLSPSDFEILTVEKGRIVQEVTASGKIQPINTISVGTQVSGIVEKVFTDYNDEVKEGQLLAQLDTAVLVENKNDAKARLDLAHAKKKVADLNFKRYEKLYKDKLIAKATLEEAEVNLAAAEADVLTALADYNKAERNYGYAQITSPVSGTVISKEVEQGQTVAASLQTPTLFTIAQDLSKMQIEASVAEADIGTIQSGMKATFTVDAYPNDSFFGIIKQVRLSPTEESNVVMYTVVIEVDNSSRKLLPGMTAFVQIIINDVNDVLRIPTAALQYKPNALIRKFLPKVSLTLNPNQSVVYQLKDGKINPIVFTRGIIDASYVEVLDGLKEGDSFITEHIQRNGRK